MLAREYATSERFERRRQNVTGWLRGDEAWDEALAAVAETRPHRLLDSGCGDGLFTRVIAAPFVIGVENAPAMLERARSRGVDVRLADIEKLPFGDGEFDVVVCNWTLYHMPDLDGGVRELSGINSTLRQVGIATGVAGLGTILASHVRSSVVDGLSGTTLAGHAHAIAHGISNGEAPRAIANALAPVRGLVAGTARSALVDGLNTILLIAAVTAFAAAVASFAVIRERDFVTIEEEGGGAEQVELEMAA